MNFRRSVTYEKVAETLINTEDCLIMLKTEEVKVVCVLSDKVKLDEGRRRIYADCELIPEKFKWATDADCMITLYEPSISSVLSPEQQRIAVLRALMKIKVDTSDIKRKISIIDYDLKDFRAIVERFGVDWDREPTLFDGVDK